MKFLFNRAPPPQPTSPPTAGIAAARLLQEAGLCVVPFQAFGVAEDSGWFRLSVGAVSMAEIEKVMPRVRSSPSFTTF